MKTKRIISAVLASIMSLSLTAITTYAAGSGKIIVDSKVEDKIVNNDIVFVGESVDTVISFEAMDEYNAYDMYFKYNSDAVQLSALDGSADAELKQVYAFRDQDPDGAKDFLEEMSIDVSDFGYDYYDPSSIIIIPKIVAEGKNNMGFLGLSYSALDSGDVAVPEKKEIFVIRYTAVGAGESGFGWATINEDQKTIADLTGGSYSISNKYKFPGLSVTDDTSNFTVLKQPDEPTEVEWGVDGTPEEYVISWQEPISTGARGYDVQIEKDGDLKETIFVEDTSIDLIDKIKTYGKGDYVISVRAKGVSYHSDYVSSDTKTVVAIPLVVGDVDFKKDDSGKDTTVLEWDAVENASGYEIVIEKDGVVVGEKVIITDPSEISKDLQDYFVEVGDYTITFTATSNTELYEEDSITVTYETGSTIQGKVKVKLSSNEDIKGNADHATTVILTDKDGNDKFRADCEEDGSFSITGVPVVEGGYTVTIVRNSSLIRMLPGKLNLDKSEVRNISTDGITIISGNVCDEQEEIAGESQLVDSSDIDHLSKFVGATKGGQGYNADVDIAYSSENQDNAINGFDLMVILANYNLGSGQYNYEPYASEHTLQ